jgi:hypothetical protein
MRFFSGDAALLLKYWFGLVRGVGRVMVVDGEFRLGWTRLNGDSFDLMDVIEIGTEFCLRLDEDEGDEDEEDDENVLVDGDDDEDD